MDDDYAIPGPPGDAEADPDDSDSEASELGEEERIVDPPLRPRRQAADAGVARRLEQDLRAAEADEFAS